MSALVSAGCGRNSPIRMAHPWGCWPLPCRLGRFRTPTFCNTPGEPWSARMIPVPEGSSLDSITLIIRAGNGGGGEAVRDFAAHSMLQRVVAASLVLSPRKASTRDTMDVVRPQGREPFATDGTKTQQQEDVRPSRRTYSAAEVFQCQKESLFYSQVLQKMLPAVAHRETLRFPAAGASGGDGHRRAGAAPWSTARGGAWSQAEHQEAQGPPDGRRPLKVVEFGTGDGMPVVNSLIGTRRFDGTVYGFELNPTSARLARDNAAAFGLSEQYQVCCGQRTLATSAPGHGCGITVGCGNVLWRIHRPQYLTQ
ncbi:hypothetical protein Vafri_13703 [Volvox africanus]|uniref:Methyltransferase domain-containing protein n=1 Tax=Volvox africanus TaxID=51714 RepID=A0A8J4F600_9CHLO|nr:hypothetical protein Vafri_13703 [Volvox africanus]